MTTKLRTDGDADDLMTARAREWRLAFDHAFARAPDDAAQAEMADFPGHPPRRHAVRTEARRGGRHPGPERADLVSEARVRTCSG